MDLKRDCFLTAPTAALSIFFIPGTGGPCGLGQFDLEMEIKQFYHQFFDLALTDEMVQNILNNQGMRKTLDAR